MKVDMKLTNNKLPGLSATLQNAVASLIEQAAQTTALEARQRVPVDTGRLKEGIRVEQQGKFAWRVTSKKFYGRFHEYGTVKMAAHPFMTPAARRARKWLNSNLKQIEDAI